MTFCRRTCESLMSESKCRLDHPAAAKFRQHVTDGDWTKADHDLQELKPMLGPENSLVVRDIPKFCSLRFSSIQFCRRWSFCCWSRSTWSIWRTRVFWTPYTFYVTNWHRSSTTRNVFTNWAVTWCAPTRKSYWKGPNGNCWMFL